MPARITDGDMNALCYYAVQSSGRLTRTLLFVALLLLTACAPEPTPTFFVPPTAAPPQPTTLPPASSSGTAPTLTATPYSTATSTSAAPCLNNLAFLQDVTIPDGTSVAPGGTVDKQWLVSNSGTCDWDSGYRLKLVNGDALGAAPEGALYPARAGSQATLRIVFTAPTEAGSYESSWQAVAPDGAAFGEPVYMQIVVAP